MRPIACGAGGRQQIVLEANLGGAGAGASRKRIDPGLRLLADLLAQVVRIAALGRRDGVPFDVAGLAIYRRAIEGHQAHAGGGKLGELAVLHHERAAGVLENRGDIGGDEILAVA